jgi:hypothetical protein
MLIVAPGLRFFTDAAVAFVSGNPVVCMYQMKPFQALKLTTTIIPAQKTVTGQVELQLQDSGLKVEVKSGVFKAGWTPPLLEIGFLW